MTRIEQLGAMVTVCGPAGCALAFALCGRNTF
jgi:hypothetical protein